VAIKLSPRQDHYRANLAGQYLNAGKYDDAIAIWDYLKNSDDPEVAKMAAVQAETSRRWKDKPLLRLEGEVSMERTSTQWRRKDSDKVDPELKKLEDKQNGIEDETAPAANPDQATTPDMRVVKFLKGTLSKVDCADDSSAVLTVVSGGKTFKFLTKNSKETLVIGEDNFSCDWKNRKVSINYKPKNATTGDIVSVEVQ
jgi:hypothetical protein